MESTQANNNLWGARVAAALNEFPAIQDVLQQGGITHDPSPLLDALADPSPAATAFKTSLQAVFQTINQGMTHHMNSTQSTCDAVLQASAEKDQHMAEKDRRIAELHTHVAQLLAREIQAPRMLAPRRQNHTDPAKFNGKSTTSEDKQTRYNNWATLTQANLAIDTAYFDTDLKHFHYIFSLMEGGLLDTYREDFQNIVRNSTLPATWRWTSPAALWSTLDAQFNVVNTAQKAEHELLTVVMAQRDFHEFYTEFDTLAKKAKKNDAEKVMMLKSKITAALHDMALHRETQPGKEDYLGWSKLYADCWERKKDREHIARLRNMNPALQQDRNFQNRPTTTSTTTATDPDAMQLDAFRQGRPDRGTCIQQGLCFYCKNPGHSVYECNEKKTNDAKFGRTGTLNNQQGVQTYSNARSSFQARRRGNFAGAGRGQLNAQPQRTLNPPATPYFNRSLDDGPTGYVLGEVPESVASSVASLKGHVDHSANSPSVDKPKN